MPRRAPAGGVPLPQGVASLIDQVPGESQHPGLLLDKHLRPCVDQTQQRVEIERVCRAGRFKTALKEEWLPRRNSLIEVASTSKAIIWERATSCPLTLHLSRASSLENAGICLHRVFGFAYLPGSGLKGMARAYAETIWLPTQRASDGEKAARERIERVFGRTAQGKDRGASSGEVVFHDAWPTSWPQLELDIVNNHHRDYYAAKDAAGDWESPNPVSFMSLAPGQRFSFAIAARSASTDPDLVGQAREWLDGALSHLGAGAKTAAGYGYFAEDHETADSTPKGAGAVPESRCVADAQVELVTPAFLAGARQGAEDCVLRAATLRGLLRWWWRTMHAGALDYQELLALEAALWGDTRSGSAIQVQVIPREQKGPTLFNFKDRFRPTVEFREAHALETPPSRVTQGVFYASYGMDERRGGRSYQRYFLEPGSKWTVRLIARPASFYPNRSQIGDRQAKAATIDGTAVIEQAVMALWLLCTYGGVGSKAGKGFGSLQIQSLSSHLLAPSAEQDSATGGSSVAGVRWSEINLGDARSTAQKLRASLDLRAEPSAKAPDSSSVDHMLEPLEKVTTWQDPWYALDQVGLYYQLFARSMKHNSRKAALGLPRKIHGPRDRPLNGQDGSHHQPPEPLSSIKGDRFSSPVHFHISRNADGTLLCRVTAFPSTHLPDIDTSRDVLKLLRDSLSNQLADAAQHAGRAAPRRPREGGHRGRTAERYVPRPTPQAPRPGARVDAVLLEEKTKKGGWRACHPITAYTGPIINTADVPEGSRAGETVTLIVASVTHGQRIMSFRWPTE